MDQGVERMITAWRMDQGVERMITNNGEMNYQLEVKLRIRDLPGGWNRG
jgi:hypothetical protein